MLEIVGNMNVLVCFIYSRRDPPWV